jgi:UDP-GlcNAc:undecaprenyl-phosphate/decaprenyl-phosphate GlcNAc-1-phosphate transferase
MSADTMRDMLFLFAASFGLCLLLTPAARELARFCGLVDRPDGRRKLHTRPTPLAGGLALIFAVSIPLGLALLLGRPLLSDNGMQLRDLGALLAGAVVICLVGVADDFGCLRGRHKVLGQVLASGVVMLAGVRIEAIHVFGLEANLGVLALPVTLLVLLGAVNSLNLMDGMDGLLSSIGFIVCLALGLMALVNGHITSACLAFALAGALLGFLCYNLPPASVFLGDSGSMVIGLTIGVLSIRSFLKGPATVTLAAPFALLILPIFDTLTGRSIFSTDRAHMHHCLLRKGLTVRGVLLLVAGLCGLAAAAALGSVAFNKEWIALLSAAAVVAILVCTRLFGHAELGLLGKRLQGMASGFLRFRRPGPAREVSVRLQGELDWRELWALLVDSARELNLWRVRLDVNAPAINEGYHARWDRGHNEAEERDTWRAEIPLTAQGRTIGCIELSGSRDGGPVWETIAALARLLQDFDAKAGSLTSGAFARALPGYVPILDSEVRSQEVVGTTSPAIAS